MSIYLVSLVLIVIPASGVAGFLYPMPLVLDLAPSLDRLVS